MSEAPQETAAAAPEPSKRPRGARRAFARRWIKRGVLVVAAVLAAAFITIFTVDIGNITVFGRSLRSVAEGEGRKYLERAFHIGRISAFLTPGKFAFDDVVIEGPTKDDRPFFRAKRITVDVPWWTLFRRDLYIEVNIVGWDMTVENWPAGGARLPKLAPKRKDNKPSTIKVRAMNIYAKGGQFTYEDHVSNWGVVARNLNFALVRAANLNTVLGLAEFTDGTTRIGTFLPMRTDFKTRFQLQGAKVLLKHIDLVTDGSRSHVDGYVNFANWPEQEYAVSSEVDFTRMREIFFKDAPWRLSGEGTFRGSFKFWKTGRELAGQFSSEEAGLSYRNAEWRFPHLHGALDWTADRFIVTHAESDFLDGALRLSYGIAPLGTPEGPMATLSADYDDVDLYRFTRQFGWTALEPQGRMRGKVAMAWPNRRPFAEGVQGSGETVILPPAGASVATATLPASAEPNPSEPRQGFVRFKPFGFFPLAADMKYRFSGTALDFEPGWAATPKTYVTFNGHARGGPVDMNFHVTSHDWQNSDRLFTALMTNFGSQVGAIPVGGRGTFDGTLTKAFNAPRIAGKFAGDQMHAWDVDWGEATGEVAIENGYMDLNQGVITYPGGGRVVTSGRYALGYPRADNGEEIHADIQVENMPLDPLKVAFDLADWPVTGRVAAATMHLEGKYEKPSDAGRPGMLRLVDGTAWDEPYEVVTSPLVFNGDGSLSLPAMKMEKGGSLISGDAWVSWDQGRYLFHAATEPPGIPVDKLAFFKSERVPFTGQLTFTASGDSTFDSPAWTLNGLIADLYAGDEGIGTVAGHLTMANETLQLTVNAESVNRLRATGGGEIKLNDTYDAKLHLTVINTSLDPYLKFFTQEMPYTKAIAGGTVSIVGPLNDPAKLDVRATIDKANLTLFDYPLENDGDLRLSFRNNVFNLDRVQFKGEGTELNLSGAVDADARTANVLAKGQASLAVLQAFYPDLRASGTASLEATLSGSFDAMSVGGSANITDGALRHPAMPQGFTGINGPIVMQQGRVSVDGLRAVMGEGPVLFSGAIVLDGYRPTEYNLEAHGRSMHLRVPDGLRSTVNADVALNGPIKSPVLSGTVDVLRASYAPRVQTQAGYYDLLTGNAPESQPPPSLTLAPEAEAAFPLTLAIRVRSGITPFIENSAGTIFGRADVDITGTIAKPIVTGQVVLDHGDWVFSGYRYRLQGGLIEFSNPLEFDPFFDLSATTRVRSTGQYFDVNLRLSGTLSRLNFTINSEPWLPEFQLISLLLGESPVVGRAELLSRSAPQELQAQALRTAGAAFLASPISATVGTVAERLTNIQTVQIVPILGNETELQQLSPTLRLILGQRISDRVYLTYARTLANTPTLQNEIILIEFDQNDQVSWVLSRNEDRSFALDFRIRYVFK